MLQAQLTSQSLPLKSMSGTLVSPASTGVSGLDVVRYPCPLLPVWVHSVILFSVEPSQWKRPLAISPSAFPVWVFKPFLVCVWRAKGNRG